MTKEEAIKYLEKRKEKALMLMENSKADTPINNKVRGILTRKIEVLDMAISALSADVRENKHGHWIEQIDHEELHKAVDMAEPIGEKTNAND